MLESGPSAIQRERTNKFEPARERGFVKKLWLEEIVVVGSIVPPRAVSTS